MGDVGVLVLVDQQVAEAPLVLGQNLGIAGQQGQVVQQQIAEIDGVHRHQALLVLPVKLDRPAASEIAGIRAPDLLGAEAAVLPALDHRQQQPRRPAPLVDVLGLQDLL